MTKQRTKRKKSWIPWIIVFWPLIIILIEFLVLWIALSAGCRISAQGPQPCHFLGNDVGEYLYPLWTVGLQLGLAIWWIIPALAIWFGIEAVRSRVKK